MGNTLKFDGFDFSGSAEDIPNTLRSLNPADPVDVGASTITDGQARALARAIPNLFKRWKLSDTDSCNLLGGMSRMTWSRWKKGNVGRIDRDLRMRMAHLIGIHMGIRTLFQDPSDGYAWIREPNERFGGLRVLDVMLRGEMADLAYLRNWIGAEIGI